METLVFYSYTGGVGRSRLLAIAARSLASRGKGVVALDLDFEAPGLHYKLGCEVLGACGAVPYLIATAQGSMSPPPLEEHVIGVTLEQGSGGWLRLMPAGPAPNRTYWSALKQLGKQVRFDDSSGQGLMSLLDLQARIEEELKPDYLLIDVRAGVTELGGLATTILADTIVCLFLDDEESLAGTIAVVKGLKAAPRLKGQLPVRVVPVLAREVAILSGRFLSTNVKELLRLGEEDGASGERPPRLYALLIDDPLKSQMELFHNLFPSSFPSSDDAEDAQGALGA